jgi:hypothetical protein
VKFAKKFRDVSKEINASVFSAEEFLSTALLQTVGTFIAFSTSHGTRKYLYSNQCGKFKSPLLGAFTKLREASISFVMSVRLSVRTEQLGSHWTDFHEI